MTPDPWDWRALLVIAILAAIAWLAVVGAIVVASWGAQALRP